MALLQTLNSRYAIAKAATKAFHDEVKRNIDDYEATTPADGKLGKKNGVYNRHVASSRYDMTIPYIFATHESMTASFFENMPDIVVTGRTNLVNKAEIVKSMYDYFKDVADLDEFLSTSAWWFFLTGMVKADVDYVREVDEYVPQLDQDGQPMLDEMGEPITIPSYSYNDPKATVENPLKTYFSPESEFSIDGKKIPYYFKDRLVDTDEIMEVYGVEVEADEVLDVDDVSKEHTEDLKRARVMYYYGKLPSTDKEELLQRDLEWAYDAIFKIYFTKDKILLAERIEEKPCKLARFYTTQNKFYGFGIGKTLRPFQEDMSIRRSQQLAYADRFAFPWLMLPNGTIIPAKDLNDYKKTNPLVVKSTDGTKPEYLVPPTMPSVITDADNAVRGDAQFVSGTLDLSKGAQQTNTVKTATGQQLFAQSQDKRLNKARKSLAKYYREVVIQMFKLARDNWDDHKTLTYTDDEGEERELEISTADLMDIDFDTDIDFNLDSVSVNQDVMSQRWISLLETSVNVPVANMEKIYAKVLKESYKISNPEAYIKTPEEMQAEQMQGQGMPVENPETMPMEQTLGSQLAPESPYVG